MMRRRSQTNNAAGDFRPTTFKELFNRGKEIVAGKPLVSGTAINRRNLLKAGAVAAAGILLPPRDAETAGRAAHQEVPNSEGPFEVDLRDRAAVNAGLWRNSSVDGLVQMEELYPGDPGQLNGIHLRVCDSGEFLLLGAWAGTHCFGSLEAVETSRIARAVSAGEEYFEIGLFEVNPSMMPLRPSGFRFVYTSAVEPQLRLYAIGLHCLGVLKGAPLDALLQCVAHRSLQLS